MSKKTAEHVSVDVADETETAEKSAVELAIDLEAEPMGVVAGRYALLERIGRGGQAEMYAARDKETDELVAVKKLGVDRIDNWKALELFEREGEVLANLDHPAIPQYVDAFSYADQETESAEFYLVQEYVEGTDFAELLEDDTRFDEADVVALLEEVLEVLVYLQSLNPPIIHRDLKPSNLIRRPDERIAVVDFGAIQATLPHTMVGGSTIVASLGQGGTLAVTDAHPIIGQIAGAISSLVVVGAAVYLGYRVLDGHPALARPRDIDIAPLSKPAIWLGGWIALLAAAGTGWRLVGFDLSSSLDYVVWIAQSAFFAALMVVLGYAGGCAWRVFSGSGE